jgi:hypothetical protein
MKIYNKATNDADYKVQIKRKIDGKTKLVWICPYYRKWFGVLCRVFSPSYRKFNPTYGDVTICDEWLIFSNFIKWVDSQPNKDWVNCDLDKDFLIDGNRMYCPESCAFIDKGVNRFILSRKNDRGEYLLGVDKKKYGKLYRSRCNNPFTKISSHLGEFKTELEAHKAWQAKKHEYACQLADLQDDPRVAKALRERYAPDKDWTNI